MEKKPFDPSSCMAYLPSTITPTPTQASQPQLLRRGPHTCTSGHVSTSITSLRHCPACGPYHGLALVSGTAMQPTCSTARA